MNKTSHDLPNMMDGIIGTDKISDIFGNTYKTLYNSVGFDIQNMINIENEIDSHINMEFKKSVKTISVQEVKDAIGKLKLGKKEENGLFTNHLVYGSDRLIVLITLLFNCLLYMALHPKNYFWAL